MIKVVNKNIIFFLFGFCIYITMEVLFRGKSYPVSGIMGGLAIVLIDKINDRISWRLDLSVQAIIGSLIITGIELVVGKIMKHTNLIPMMWDYSNLPLNYDGIICVPFSVAWLFLSVAAIFLADCINYYVLEEGERPRYILFGRFAFFFKRKRCDDGWHEV